MTVLDRKLITRMVTPQPGGNGGGGGYVPQSQDVSWTDINGKPTTLAGYGITDAYWATTQSTSDKRNLTIGSVTQQVITAHQSLYGYATEYWVGQQGYATQTWVGQQGFATQTWVGNNYLPLTGGTMTGTLKVATGYGISDATDNGLLVYHPVDWTGVTSSQWGVGAVDSEGVIRSSNNALKHYRYNDGTYEIIDSKGGQTIANSLQIASVKIEQTNEVNSYQGALHLNYRLASDVTACIGGGNFGIGTTSPGHKLHVVGRIYCTGGFAFLSDIRKKDVITKDLHISVGDIAKAPLIRYTLKNDEKKEIHIGSVAQYWQNVMPETINKSNDGTLSMDYGTISLVSVVTLARKLETLEKELSDIKKSDIKKKLITK